MAGVVQGDGSLGCEGLAQLGRGFGACMKALIAEPVAVTHPAGDCSQSGSMEP